jgi:hypothetical protein
LKISSPILAASSRTKSWPRTSATWFIGQTR